MSNKNISRRHFLGLMGVGAAGLALAACSKEDNNTSSMEATESASESTAENAVTPRVVVLNTGQLENVLSLGIVPVGAAKAKGGVVIPEFVRENFGSGADLDSIADCGLRDNPDLETIASLKPTIICANQRTDEAIINQLKEIAPVVLGKGRGVNWKPDLLTIGEGLGMGEQAQQLLDSYEEGVAQLKEKLGANPPTVSFLRTKGDQFEVFGPNSFTGTIAEDLGLPRPENQAAITETGLELSAEELGQADADWIFYGSRAGDPSPADTTVWSTLKAVEKKQAVEVDYEPWFVNASVFAASLVVQDLEKNLVK